MGTTLSMALPSSGGGGCNVIVRDDGVLAGAGSTLNFTGPCVTVTDAGNGQANIAITCGGSTTDSCPTETTLIGAAGLAFTAPNGSYYMFIGRDPYGWTNGNWDTLADTPLPGVVVGTSIDNINCAMVLTSTLVNGDKIKFSGTSGLFLGSPSQPNPLPQLSVNLSYQTCASIKDIAFKLEPLILTQKLDYTFVRASEEDYRVAYLCFSLEVTLAQILQEGTLIFATFGVDNTTPYSAESRISFSVNSIRNCAEVDLTPNMEIQNCCDPQIVEVIFNSTLDVGDYFVDNEGNCWEAQAKTAALVTSTRTITDKYNNCDACRAANPCPENLVVESCCAPGVETFTGSLPGINVGDTFVDTYGFCWTAVEETSSPITGMVMVDTNLGQDSCEECKTANPCPITIELVPCCEQYIITTPIITTADLFGYTPIADEIVVDTFGNCWRTKLPGFIGNVTAPFLEYASSYGNTEQACADCTTASPCGSVLYYSLVNCCTGETEVMEIDIIISPETTLIIETVPGVNQCYKVISFSDVGTATMTGKFVASIDSCEKCIDKIQACPKYYTMQDCCGVLPNAVMFLPAEVSSNPNMFNSTYPDQDGNCWTVIEESSSTIATVIWAGYTYEFSIECVKNEAECTIVPITSCCGTMSGTATLEGLGGGVAVGDTFVDQFGMCWAVTADAIQKGDVTYNFLNAVEIYSNFYDCENCKMDNPCPDSLYYRIQNCNTNKIETIYASSNLFGIGESYSIRTSLDPEYYDCWKTLSYSTTGVESITLLGIPISKTKKCTDCFSYGGGVPHDYYEVRDCCGTQPNQVMYLANEVRNQYTHVAGTNGQCYEIVGLSTSTTSTVVYGGAVYNDCQSCINDYGPC